MASKKKLKKGAARRKTSRVVRKAKKSPPKRSAKAKAPTRKASKPASQVAAKMASFSKQVLGEEETPVQVRTFNEARAGIEASKELDVRSGSATPASDAGYAPAAPPRKPAMQPLSGPAAVPRSRPSEEFQVATPPRKGKQAEVPTREDLGKIELRMQRGTKDATIARAGPDYLQRSFNRAAQQGKTRATSSPTREDEDASEFEVEKDREAGDVDAKLTDFGDVEIAQQTRRGRRTLGRLDTDDEKEST